MKRTRGVGITPRRRRAARRRIADASISRRALRDAYGFTTRMSSRGADGSLRGRGETRGVPVRTDLSVEAQCLLELAVRLVDAAGAACQPRALLMDGRLVHTRRAIPRGLRGTVEHALDLRVGG